MAPSRAPGRRDGDCYCCKVWMNGLMLLFFVLGAFSSVWVFRVLEDCRFIGRKVEVRGRWEEKAQIPSSLYNLSTNQLQALALLLSSLDQGLLSECLGKSVADGQLNSSLSYALSVLQKEKHQLIGEQHLNMDNLVSQGQVPVHHDYASVQPFDLSPSHEDMLDIDLQNTLPSLNHLMPLKANDISHGGEISSTHTHKRILPVISVSILIIVIGVIVFSRGFSLGKARTSSVQQFQKQKHCQPQNSKVGVKLMKKVLFLGVSAGFLASAYIFFIMKADFIERRKETLTNMCDERARVLQDQFNVSMNHVHALAILVSTFHHGKNPSAIDQKTFEEYTASTAFERPLMSGVAYALKVLHSQREQVEMQHGWKIKKMDTENHSPVQDDYFPGKLMPSPVQDEYAPVIFSQETVAHIVSIDMMSGKEDRENILRARATGKGVLTYPFKLLKSNHLGVVLTFAVYSTVLPPNATPEQRIEATVGYLGASFDVPSLVEKLLQQLSSKQTIVVNLYDTTNASAPIKMYDPDDIGAGEMHISNVDFGDPTHKHEMHCRFTLKTPLPWLAIQTSLGIGVIVFLIGYIIYAAINTIEKVEDDYQQMRELKVRAEAADVAKSQFLATVSHEIRTPMNGVLGMLQMLMDTELDTTQQDFATTAQSSGKALISLINEVLDLAKIESGRLELEAVPFDVRDVLDNVLSLFSDKSQAKHIELAVYVSNRVPEVLVGDPGRFRQIITNLVGNSVKFTEQGHIFVSVHLVEEVKSSCDISPQVLEDELEVFDGRYSSYKTLSGYRVADKRKSWENFSIFKTPTEASDKINLLVTVEDTGVGIPQEAQRRIFTPFMQADSSTSRTYGGTGIGLSISKSLVNLMGGEIGFVSKPGTGSAFSFTALFVEGQKKSNDVKRHKPDSSTSDFEGMRGLIADGRSIRAEIAKYHLQRLGIHVQITSTRESTLATIADSFNSRTQRLDMVLVDKDAWGKGSSGLPFFHPLIDTQRNGKIRSQDPPKIILLATSLNPGEVDDLKSEGYADVMVKPLRLSMIAACLRKALGVGNKRQAKRQPVALQSLLNGKKILVVDDNAVNRRVAAGVLKKFGAIVTCVDSGKTAIEMLLPPHAFDACFMDVQMPEMDGFEATRQIRSMESKINNLIKSGETSLEAYGNIAHWHVPILAMTADVIQATYEECLRCGMDDYVSKPFEEQQLYSAVAHFFDSDTTEVGSE